MLTPLHELWRARRGRRAAVVAISPLVRRSRNRLRGIPEQTWHQPSMVGFIVMLITLAARRSVKALDTNALARVQCEAWAEITGMNPEVIGEEVLHLSASLHKDFCEGCRDAITFSEALDRRPATGAPDLVAAWDRQEFALNSIELPVDPESELAALWENFFEARVSKAPAAPALPVQRERLT